MLFWLIVAACTPAATPEHLQYTPGLPIVVTRNTFAGNGFSLQYPDGWRIVTGEASAPPTATFVSPDNCAIILVAVGSAEPITSPDCADEQFQTASREIVLDSLTLTLAGSAPAAQWEIFLPQFEQVAASITSSALNTP